MNVLKILVLCRGNVTRSPFIAGYLNHLYRTSELANELYLDIDSSGIEGKSNRPPHPKILQKGLELGFDLAMYRSKHSSFKDLKEMDLIFVVDIKQYKRFIQIYPQLLHKVFNIMDFGRAGDYSLLNIEDPSLYDDEEEFEKFYKIAIAETERVWEYIKQEYYQTKAEGKNFSPELFWKDQKVDVSITKKYSYLTKRFFPLCPYCQSKRIKRLKRRGYIQKRILPKLGGYPYHCGNCGRDVMLFIGSNLSSKRHGEEKQVKWKRFIEMEMEQKHKESNG